MSGLDSILNPVACRISYTGSYPSARSSAPTRLGSNSARLAADDMACGSHFADMSADMACQLCMLTSCLHQVDVIPSMPTVHDDITNTSCWRHQYQYPGQSHGSGQLVFGLGLPIREKKTRGARLRAWTATSSARAGMSDVWFSRHFHQWLRLFLLYTVVWSKHNFDNFYFWAKNQIPL